MHRIARALTAAVLVAFAGCASTGSGRGALTLEDVADEVAPAYDVIFFGEQHDNSAGHMQQLEMLRLLHQRRPDVVLTMEMFERDVQPTIDRYLADEIDEETFLAEARPWKTYRSDYRPLVEYAKANGLRVLAANAPKSVTDEMKRGKYDWDAPSPHVAAEVPMPKDANWKAFKDAMMDHQGVEDETLERFYRVQCAWDATMADTIVKALDAAGDAAPLVMHVCGQFHAEDGRGTVARVREFRPGTRCAVLTMDVMPTVSRRGDGQFSMLVPPEPTRPSKGVDTVAAGGAAAGADVPDRARPALGFMPDYDSDDGILVEMVVDGGPASRAGLEVGDIIVRVDDQDIVDFTGYMSVLNSLTIGETVEVIADRAGKLETMKIEVGKRGH